ncbi:MULTISPECIES: ATP-binding cassette domain-containing protein [unclassified Bacillus (in: firmicutes)]|uniref:ABC transporter ATP-binding protein n=1 Tax=unclassified Bacillus (in: firmicutes) TaxID=185979 RepID=UPI0008E3217C|nr:MULTISPECIES: ATP-binding cassette domain-containing protein [unclassified Bacillus (in: firmicutes)]SFB08106.1 ABC-2 type transport system ATP-binding protein [Bacillus sp. UNCCL13]SFQ87149.1 ABC-2 type transport system ATP-binding protein [Bacillus sp. cl95]
MITVENLKKEYKLVKRDPGLKGAIKSLFVRKYETKEAVKGVSFTIKQGETVGYIGANGAGKSTTIKMLTGILTPSEGKVTVNGLVPYENRQKNAKNIGAVFGQRTQLFWDIPVRESFHLLKHIYEIPEEQYQETLAKFTEVLNLEPLLGVPVRQLSLGQKMRCELAAAFFHRPSIVYLDEPTIGLDIAVKVKIRKFIKEMNEEWGTTVLLTTHDMQDIEEICDRIIIIDDGNILYDGGLEEIKRRFGQKRVIHFEMEKMETFELPQGLHGKVAVLESSEEENKVSLSFDHEEISSSFVISEMMANYEIQDLSISDPKIETIVEQLYTKQEKVGEDEKVLANG